MDIICHADIPASVVPPLVQDVSGRELIHTSAATIGFAPLVRSHFVQDVPGRGLIHTSAATIGFAPFVRSHFVQNVPGRGSLVALRKNTPLLPADRRRLLFLRHIR